MQSVPARSAEEADANRTFNALLGALSRPGRTRELSAPGEGPIVDALVDRECRVFSANPRLLPWIERSGAELVALRRADYAFLGTLVDADQLEELARGTDLYPDAAATAVVRVVHGRGPRLRLSGPGIDGAIEVRVDGLPEGFWDARAEAIRYPLGFDLFLVDGARVMGLPRSTAVEAL